MKINFLCPLLQGWTVIWSVTWLQFCKKKGEGEGGETRECGEKPVEQGLETTKKWY